jgi:hypothetical protein
MKDNLEQNLTLKPSRLKWSLILLSFLLLGLVGFLMFSKGNYLGIGGIIISFFGVLFCVWVMISSRMNLHLSSKGFNFGTVKRISDYKWTDISSFDVARISYNDIVCFTFSDSYYGEMKTRSINQGFGGFDRFLPDTYGLKAADLVALLESWRKQHSNMSSESIDVDRA